MEEFFGSISERLTAESKKIGTEIEPWQKTVIKKGYICMADCFTPQRSLKECQKCVNYCDALADEPQKEVEKLIGSVHDGVDSCFNMCMFTYGDKLNSQLRDCMEECSKRGIIAMSDLKTAAIETMKSYAKKDFLPRDNI
jgi:hypothetical protein